MKPRQVESSLRKLFLCLGFPCSRAHRFCLVKAITSTCRKIIRMLLRMTLNILKTFSSNLIL